MCTAHRIDVHHHIVSRGFVRIEARDGAAINDVAAVRITAVAVSALVMVDAL